jgi:transposase
MMEQILLFFLSLADNSFKNKELRQCEDANPTRWLFKLSKSKLFKHISSMGPQSNEWPVEPESSCSPPKASTQGKLRSTLTAAGQRFGASVTNFETVGWRRSTICPAPAHPAGFPPLQRTQIQALACLPPGQRGLALTHWSTRDLAQQIVRDNIVTEIHYSTVWKILDESELQPHRYHYWKTQIAEDFLEKAATVLWYYEQARRLAQDNILVICLDEKPSIQALERRFPTLAMEAGRVEHREHEYIRHGVTHLMAGFRVHDGLAWGRCFFKKSQAFFIECLDRLAHRFREAKKIHFITDNDSTHKGKPIEDFLHAQKDKAALHYTPVHASWLNQAEILLSIISRKYLRRGSWSTIQELKKTLGSAISERNRFDKHPFDWSFTRHAMRDWYAKYCFGT